MNNESFRPGVGVGAGSRRVAAVMLALCLAACSAGGGGGDQQSFSSPEAAFEALVAALEKNDTTAMTKLLGPGVEDVLDSGDAVGDRADRERFVAAYKARHALEASGGEKSILIVGEEDFPFPIPAIRRDGRWYLDGAEGADEVVYRRVGRNELGAIAVLRGLVAAQREYAAEGHDGDPPGIYALKLVSDPGFRNGLYWPTAADEPPSPAGEFVAQAAAEGYRRAAGAPYHGYRYRLLYRQGPNANGGAREYFVDGLLTGGFAVLAWPAEYGVSGIMTFVVNQDGVVFQKDLGDATPTAAEGIGAFDPDSSWAAITPEG
jgi:hypothetical protein